MSRFNNRIANQQVRSLMSVNMQTQIAVPERRKAFISSCISYLSHPRWAKTEQPRHLRLDIACRGGSHGSNIADYPAEAAIGRHAGLGDSAAAPGLSATEAARQQRELRGGRTVLSVNLDHSTARTDPGG